MWQLGSYEYFIMYDTSHFLRFDSYLLCEQRRLKPLDQLVSYDYILLNDPKNPRKVQIYMLAISCGPVYNLLIMKKPAN